MQRLTTLLLAILFLMLFTNFAWSDDGIDIIQPNKVAALTSIQKKIDSIGQAVTGCVGTGKKHGACMCESEELILNFNGAVEKLFETYTDLKTMDLVRFRMPNGMSVAQSLSGIKNQAQMKLSCN